MRSYGGEVLLCPYCKQEQYTHEPDTIDSLMCYTECEHCGRTFWYSFSHLLGYESEEDEDLSEEQKEQIDDYYDWY